MYGLRRCIDENIESYCLGSSTVQARSANLLAWREVQVSGHSMFNLSYARLVHYLLWATAENSR